ncbi:hypothetical protein K438DRAFT_1982025 [Mycena galopus ATCC 62051]|nr:hypothetical protein K438DRAFT_1982025 [Mycena galopus ATCC 62051]
MYEDQLSDEEHEVGVRTISDVAGYHSSPEPAQSADLKESYNVTEDVAKPRPRYLTPPESSSRSPSPAGRMPSFMDYLLDHMSRPRSRSDS